MIHVIWTSACFWQQWFLGQLLLRKWEDEKTEKLKELASSETSCREVDDEDNGQVRKDAKGSKAIHFQTDVRWHGINHGRGGRWARRADQKDPGVREVLQRHRGEAPVQRSGKRGRSPLPQEPPYPPPKKLRRSGKAFSKRSKARYAKLDDKRELSKVEVQELRYSQLSCKETFQCGRSVSQLVQDLLDRKVSLFAPFLRLTVFETTDEETNDPILRCIDNQRRKGPLDGERQPVQPEYTHAGPALHTELLRHRRTWCAILRSLEAGYFSGSGPLNPYRFNPPSIGGSPWCWKGEAPSSLQIFPFRTMDKSDASPHPETSKNYGVRKLRCVATRTDLKRRRQLYVAWTVSTGSSKQTAGLLAWSAAATQWIFRNGDQQLRNCYAPFMAVSKFRHAFFQVTASRKYFWPFKELEVIAIIDWLHIPVGMGATEALVYFRYISIRSTCSGNPEQVPAARTHGAHCHFEDFVIQKT